MPYKIKTKPTLTIGHHLLEGKIAALPKPLAVLFRTPSASRPLPRAFRAHDRSSDGDFEYGEDTEMMTEVDDGDTGAKGRCPSWDVVAIVRRKILFSKRPMPVVGHNLDKG